MFVMYDERPSDSPFVEKVWRSRSGDSGELLSVAASRVEIVIARVRSRTLVTVRGPDSSRVGTAEMHQLLSKIVKGLAGPEDLRRLTWLCEMVRAPSLCGLGLTAPIRAQHPALFPA